MLKIVVPAAECWDEEHQEFINTKETVLELEHSLLSLSKWESKWCVPFLGDEIKTDEQTIDYIRCMTINHVDPKVYYFLTAQNIESIKDYINAKMTATFFNDLDNGQSREIITSELIYYWMIQCNIPFECQKWHLNRLITLVRVCSIKQSPPKKMSRSEILRRNAELNAQRRAKLNTKG